MTNNASEKTTYYLFNDRVVAEPVTCIPLFEKVGTIMYIPSLKQWRSAVYMPENAARRADGRRAIMWPAMRPYAVPEEWRAIALLLT